MKWIIRIACFLATTAIYIPIESALSSTNTGRPLVWFLTGIIYCFIFYIPSRALISMWDKHKASTVTNNANVTSAQPPRTPQPEREPFYHITTKDGESLRIPQSKMDDYYAANTSKEIVDKSRSLCAFLMQSSINFAKNVDLPCNYHCFTYFWNALYLSVKDIAKKNRVDDMMTHQYRMLITSLLKDKPNSKKLIGDLNEFQLKSQEVLSRCISDPRSPDGMAEILSNSISIMYGNDASNAPLDAVLSAEYVIAVLDVTEYAIQLFDKPDALTMFANNLSTLLLLTQDKKNELQTLVSHFQTSILGNSLITIQAIDDFIDHLYIHGYIVPSFEQYRDLGMNAILTHKIYIPEEHIPYLKDWLRFEDWHTFKSAALDACILLTHNSSDPSIKEWHHELARILPEIFNPEETDLQVILERIIQIAEEGWSENTSLPEYIAQLAGEVYVPEHEIVHNMDHDIEKAIRRYAVAISVSVEPAPIDFKGQMLRRIHHINRYKSIREEQKRRLTVD